MIQASQAFRDAVRLGKPQRAVLKFEDATFTNEDISMTSGGITFYERFNESTDLTVGVAPSSGIRVTMINRDGKLNDFKFGKFTAAIGACVEEKTYTRDDVNGKTLVPVAGKPYKISYESDTVTEWWGNWTKRVYELVKLGTFIAPRPAVIRKYVVTVEADDQMTLFDEMWAKDLPVQYPVTLGGLLSAICKEAGVTLKSTSFLNSDMTVEEEPEDFENATVREVVAWIAEAACGYARFDREGQMEIVWFSDTEQTYDEHDYQEFTPYSYQVHPIDRLNVRNQNSDKEAVLGEGENAYMIQNNPFLRQDDSAEAAAIALAEEGSGVSPIYDRLSAFPAFNPSSAELFTDWSVQAGDVVSVRSGADTFSVPVYSMTMNWNGAPKITLENSGEETREPLPEMQRQSYGAGRGAYQEKKRLDGLQTWAYTNVDELNARIDLDAGAINELTGWRSEASIAIDGLQAAIALTASKESVDELTGRVEQAESQLVVQAGQISSKVAAGDIASAINQTAQSVLIQADKIDLQGYVTAEALETIDAKIDNLVSGLSQFKYLYAEGGWVNGEFTIAALTAGSIKLTTGPLTIGDTDLCTHYHTFSEGEEGTITIGGPSATPGSFNIADTQFYKDGVSAAASRVVIDMNTLETLYNSIQNSYEIRATLSNRNPVRISVPADEAYEAGYAAGQSAAEVHQGTSHTTYDADSHTYTVRIPILNESDETVLTAEVTITASRAYNAGADSVTLYDPVWDGYVQGDSNSFTVSASNGKSVSQQVYMAAGASWSSGNRYVYMRTGTNATQRARLAVSLPDSGTWAWSNPAKAVARA